MLSLTHILKRKLQLKQTNVTHAVPGSNKVFNLAPRRKCLPTPGVNYRDIPGYCSQQSALMYLLPQYGRRKDFSRGGQLLNFSRGSQKAFSSRGQKS